MFSFFVLPIIGNEWRILIFLKFNVIGLGKQGLPKGSIFFPDNPDGDPPEVKAHKRLGEVLSVLKGVLNKYQPLHSTDILASAGTLISKVKSHNYQDTSKAPDEFYESIDQLALAFSSR